MECSSTERYSVFTTSFSPFMAAISYIDKIVKKLNYHENGKISKGPNKIKKVKYLKMVSDSTFLTKYWFPYQAQKG